MEEEKDTLVPEKRKWQEPCIKSFSIVEETLGDGNWLSDEYEGGS